MGLGQIRLGAWDILRGDLSVGAGSALLAAAVIVARAGSLIAGGPDAILAQMPDQAFSYAVLAKNFAATGQWSFDGVAPASSFPLLWTYALAGLYSLFPDLGFTGLVAIANLVSLVCFALAAWLMINLLAEHYGRAAAAAVLMVLLGGVALRLPAMGVETPFALLAGAFAAWLSFTTRIAPRLSSLALALLAGFAGMLARADFGLLALALLGGAFLTYLAGPVNRAGDERALYVPGTLCAGAVLGLAAIAAQSWLVSGDLVPASLRMKYHWSSLEGHALGPALGTLNLFRGNSLLPLPGFGLLFMLVLAGLGLRSILNHRLAWAPPAAGMLALLFYLLLYGCNAQGLEPWHAGSLLVPAMLLFGPALAPMSRRGLARWRRGLAYGAAGLVIAAGLLGSLSPLWPHHAAYRASGLYLASEPGLSPVGAFDAGIVAYFAKRPVVNLDGLLNDAVYPYAVKSRLADYIRQRSINHLIAFEIMLSARRYSWRGGYADRRLRRCAEPLRSFTMDAPDRRWQGTDLVLYRLNGECLLRN